ncbi:ABC transporter ATP-binding protein [Pelagibacterium halotolerans]|uniref:Putative peptide ABC transporter, ATP-binding protein n=1 Tax=Pelagibacterium halotolerans (strain DSM 22347 / JCM 15775 / CGMCC 1.7692 / B2) TaxID=1082931 RepID=G4R7J4_PELHB|nr:ATP-binding cassette domain-containing protein [Pelagibacterium halotolerans]AEQ52295.1 putative peptide ABC transporter, ATP-binding protein [Pelagibacterium halotolerans B2]QJR17958.1 ABC transporter ATP-binding protein [Pelagibacterium halotolerans]SEA32435.1 peptide/nickel transport system ATP-binding protein [Pelagibacterium halotolerans]
MSDTPLLEIDNASKVFHLKPMFGAAKEVVAMRNVSLSIQKGRALAIVGESGSGKSTIGRAVTRLFRLSEGEVRFKGRNIADIHGRSEELAYSQAVQMVFQDPFAALNPAHTIRHHLERPLKLHKKLGGSGLADAVRGVLADVELDPAVTLEKYPHELSGGQRQRVNLARALAVGAELIVADEPTSMLDVSIRKSVLGLMQRMKKERGITFLYITHDIATAHYLAEDTAVMFGGQVVEWGPSESVISNPQHAYTKVLLSAVPDPNVRFVADADGGKAFAQNIEKVRALARRPAGLPVEVEPGHFVRHRFQDMDAA